MTLPNKGADALSGLLSDLDIGSDVFSRPKTLQGMKQTTTTSRNTAESMQTGGTSNVAPSGPRGTTEVSPPPTAAVAEHHSVDQLESLLRQSATTPASLPAHSDIDLDSWSFQDSGTTTASPATAAVATPPQPPTFDDPFASFAPATAVSQYHDGDPLDMFGGTPAPSKGTSTATSTPQPATFAHFEDPLRDFGGAQPPIATNPAIDTSYTSNKTQTGEINELSRHQSTAASSATSLSSMGAAQATTTPAELGPAATAASATTSATKRPSAHKAFQFLDAEEDTRPNNVYTEASAAGSDRRHGSLHSSLGGSGNGDDGGILHHRPSPAADRLPAVGAETVAEVGQRAAKALQAGTKWFMRASKQIAKDVQTRIEKHRQQPPPRHPDGTFGNNNSPSTGGPASSVPAFYYDWAAQLSRLSPNSRLAALDAMEEGDRMTVQDLMDEAALGEATLRSMQEQHGGGRDNENTWNLSEDDQTSFNTQQYQASQQPPPPPPSYEEVMAAAMSTARPAASSPSSMLPPKQKPVVVQDDLLGVDSEPVAESVESKQSEADVDLLGMTHQPTPTDGTPAAKTNNIDDMFTVRPSNTAAPSNSTTPARPTKVSSWSSSATTSTAVPDLVGGLNGVAVAGTTTTTYVDTSGFDGLYEDAEDEGDDAVGDANEPEMRRIARQKRIAAKHERMRRQLAEKREREDAEAAEKAGKVAFRDELRPKIDAWTSGRKDNIRALLSTLHTILWEGSGWTSPSIGDIMEPSKVKRWYMKANLVVHPDKVKQKGGTLEQVATADVVFDVLKAAWGKFESQNN